MDMTAPFIEPLFVHGGTATALPAGIVGWSDMGAILVWFVLVAFVGSLFGILREYTAQRRTRLMGRARIGQRRLEQPA